MNAKTIEAMPSEQAAELAALEAAAGEGAQAAQVKEAEQAAGPRVDLATELRALVGMFVGLVAPVFPSLPKIYTAETTEAAALAVAAVCNKHGWMQGGIMGDFAEEIAAAAVLAPLALATYQGVRADVAAARKGPNPWIADKAEPAAGAVVGEGGAINQKTVVFGAPIPASDGGKNV